MNENATSNEIWAGPSLVPELFEGHKAKKKLLVKKNFAPELSKS